MKKISLLSLILFACIYSFAQSKDSLKIIKTNEQGIADPERKTPSLADSINFKNLDYVKLLFIDRYEETPC